MSTELYLLLPIDRFEKKVGAKAPTFFCNTIFMKTIILLFIILLTSCIQEIPINMPKIDSYLTINALICSKSAISLNISNLIAFSDTITSDTPNKIEISIHQDGLLVANPIGPGPIIFTSVYPQIGSEYRLIVKTETDTLAASTTIPSEILISNAVFKYSNVPSQTFDLLTEASITWKDPAGVDNYYELQVLDKKMKALSFQQFDQIDDPVIQQECDLNYTPSSFVFSDKQFEGNFYTLTLRFGNGGSPTRPDSASVVLRNLSKEYYHFKKSWHKHIFLQNASLQWDRDLSFTNVYSLLFQGDPVPLYTNIQNGIGIFAGYSQDTRRFRFKEQ